MDARDEQIITDANNGFNGLGHVARAVFQSRDTIVDLDEASTRQQERMLTLTKVILGLTVFLAVLGVIQILPQLPALFEYIRGVIAGVHGPSMPPLMV